MKKKLKNLQHSLPAPEGIKCDCGGELRPQPFISVQEAIDYVNKNSKPRTRKTTKAVHALGLALMGTYSPPNFQV